VANAKRKKKQPKVIAIKTVLINGQQVKVKVYAEVETERDSPFWGGAAKKGGSK
jgi:hypothetical protein